MKLKKKFYWPELRTYCGCKLSIGIYIRSTLTVLLFGSLAIFVTLNIVNLMQKRNVFFKTANVTEIADHLDEKKFDTERAVLYYQTFILFNLFWIVFKIMYVIKTMLICYSVYKSKPTLMKIGLYIAMPSCFFDLLLSITAFFLFNHWFRVFLVIYYISEGYNFLAIYSELKKITGTSKIIQAEDIGEPSVEQITAEDNYQFNRPHCRSCSCYAVDDITPISDNSELQLYVNTSTVNYINSTRNVRSDLVSNNSSRGCDTYGDRPARPSFLALDLDAEKEKADVDTPVIYDEEQLNVCGSPIVKNR